MADHHVNRNNTRNILSELTTVYQTSQHHHVQRKIWGVNYATTKLLTADKASSFQMFTQKDTLSIRISPDLRRELIIKSLCADNQSSSILKMLRKRMFFIFRG